jgi:cholesterol 7-desaturase
MLVLSAEVEQYLPNYPTLLLIAAITVLYLIYYLLMRYCTVKMEGNYDRSKKNIGKTLPPYPNGWYIACKSKELKTNETKSIEIAGHNIVLFRNPEGKIFALYAYCSHMGANLGIGGQVVNESCIQCPFHGWLFDG